MFLQDLWKQGSFCHTELLSQSHVPMKEKIRENDVMSGKLRVSLPVLHVQKIKISIFALHRNTKFK